MKNLFIFIDNLLTSSIVLWLCGYEVGSIIEKSRLVPWTMMPIIDISLGFLSLSIGLVSAYSTFVCIQRLRTLERYFSKEMDV